MHGAIFVICLTILLCTLKFGEAYRIDISDPSQYHYEKEQDDEGNYKFSNNVYGYAIDRGLLHEETGTVAKAKSGPDNNYITVRGEYSYSAGLYIIKVTYEADENGYRARVVEKPSTGAGSVDKPPIGKDCAQTLLGCNPVG